MLSTFIREVFPRDEEWQMQKNMAAQDVESKQWTWAQP